MVGSGGDSGHVGSDVAPIPTDEDTDKSWESIILPKLVLYSFSVATLITFSRAISEIISERYRVSKHVSVASIIRYRLDLYFSTDPMAMPVALFCCTLQVIFLGGFLLWTFESDSSATLEGSMWLSWIFIADSAAHAEYGRTTISCFISFVLTIGGMLVFGFLVGILTDIIGAFFEELKKGRSRVLESGHTLILNWSNKLLPLLAELCEANASEHGGVIVVMAQRSKQDMEEEIHEYLRNGRRKGTIIVVRSGSPLNLHDLSKVNPAMAKSIVVLSNQELDLDERDSMALRVILGLKSLSEEYREWNIKQNLEDQKGHIVVEAMDIDNLKLMESLGGGRVEGVLPHDIIGQIMIRSCRTAGFSMVLESLLGFEGSEFYFNEFKELVGKTFLESLFCFPEACVLGVKPRGENVVINPSLGYVFKEGDQVVVLAEDDDTYAFVAPDVDSHKGWLDISREMSMEEKKPDNHPERYLVIGWRRGIAHMIKAFDHFVNPGSELIILSTRSMALRQKCFDQGGISPKSLQNFNITHMFGSANIGMLSRLNVNTFDSILVLSGDVVKDRAFNERQDAQCLTTLLLARDLVHRSVPPITPSTPVRRIQNSENHHTTNPLSKKIHAFPPILPLSRHHSREHGTIAKETQKQREEGGSAGFPRKELKSLTPPPRRMKKLKKIDGEKVMKKRQRNMTWSQFKKGKGVVNKWSLRRLTATSLAKIDPDEWGREVLYGKRWDSQDQKSKPKSLSISVNNKNEIKGWTSTRDRSSPSIISEILDSRTKMALRRTSSSGFVASNDMISQILAMVAERRQVRQILRELCEDLNGSEMTVLSVTEVIGEEEDRFFCFYDLMARCATRRKLLIGFKRYVWP
ncbi:hypothetical protein AAMO2058_000255500 [Amorphochlora amoebiformis]